MGLSENQLRDLCLALMSADSEGTVIELLESAGYWTRQEMWRLYGDNENNYSTIGNQQSRPDAALVEKLVNSVDARLMNECLVQGIDPAGPDAPPTVQEAVARFFDSAIGGQTTTAGRIREWPDSKRNDISRGITLAATGPKPGSGNPCFTISDQGEGQTPGQMPGTLLSLNRSNKLRIPFVQGKFNMGGTGVLKFCGHQNLQLIVSRRNPRILERQAATRDHDGNWSFTIVRREDPRENRRSSVYMYLAPIHGDERPGRGRLLNFSAESMPIFPQGRDPYARSSQWGTLIKLYEYSATGFKSHILMKDGLLGRIDLLLPDVALPMRFHECREYRGHEASFDTSLTGLRVRLEDDRAQNLEEGFPASALMNVAGEEILLSFYAFKKNRAEAYRRNEGLIFVLNGQTQGHLTQDFFARKKVGLSYISDSLLVIADCTTVSGRAREDLFMNSRDRLSGGELRQEIERGLEDLLKQHDGLRALKERRRREEVEAKLDDAKPLADILGRILRNSPTLSSLFLQGVRISTPFKTVPAQAKARKYMGRRFPTYFKFKGRDYGEVLERTCHANMRFRIAFETDAENEYFSRDVDRGEFTLVEIGENGETPAKNRVLNLQGGIASLSVSLPERASPGQVLMYEAMVNDCSRVEPFRNTFNVLVQKGQEPRPGPNHIPPMPPSPEDGKERERSSGVQLPNVILVDERSWADHSPPFDRYTALRIKDSGSNVERQGDVQDSAVYDFFVNIDNVYLRTEQKSAKSESALLQAQFKYGLVLVGLSLIQEHIENERRAAHNESNGEEAEENIEKDVEAVSRAVAPVLIPMISSLGSLSVEENLAFNASGEAT